MGNWRNLRSVSLASVGADTATSKGTAVTAHASANTKGSYTELTASCPEVQGLWLSVIFEFTTSTYVNFLLDLAIGAGGSEQIIIADLPFQARTSSIVFLPIAIPSGTRIAARVQASTGAAVANVQLLAGNGALAGVGASTVVCYGINAGDSGASSVDPGGTAHTKGSYTEITSSTSSAMKGFLMMSGGASNTVASAATFLFDVAIGAGGSEQVIVSNLQISVAASSELWGPHYSQIYWLPIPAGTRIAVRSQCSIIDATDRLTDVSIIGFS